MPQSNSGSNRFAQAVFFIVVSAVLSACAGKPKPLDPSQPFNVTEVRVITQNMEDFGFADRLQNRLSASVGRSTADIGQAALLRIVVLDRRTEFGPASFFAGLSHSVSIDLTLVDSETGQVLRNRALRAMASDRHASKADAVLISKLTDDIRILLGLAGYTPYPVRGAKRSVGIPLNKPDVGGLTDAALLSADPLLNGTVTPTTLVLDAETDVVPAMDISRPLLDANPAITSPAATEVMAPPALVKVPHSLELPAQAPSFDVGSDSDSAVEEPCIITLESDCSDPDTRR